jgi:CMP-N-acetylneuraminic acid synthetase
MLDALVEVNEIDCIIINTDARHILEANGLKECSRIRIRERKSELCGDFVSMNKIIEDDILNVESGDYLMTHTTNPLISPQTIRSAITEYKEGTAKGKDSLFSVNRYQTRFYKKNGTPINHDPDNLIRTQDLEPWYEENSNLYLFSKDSFFSANARIGTKPILFETPTTESQDIDNKIDWRTAEILALAGMLANSHTEG